MDLNVKSLLITSAVINAVLGLAYPFFAEYVYALTNSAYAAGLAWSVRGVACVAGFIIGGWLADVVGRRSPIWAGTAMLGIAQLLYASSSTWPEFMVAAAFEGLSFFYFPAFNAMLMDSASGRVVEAFTWSMVASHLPYAAAPIVGGLLRDLLGVFGLRLCFAASGLTILAVSLVRLLVLKETLASTRRIRLRELGVACVEAVSSFKGLDPSVKRLVALRALFMLSAINMFDLFAVLYATRYLTAVSYAEWGLIEAVAALAFLAAIPLGGWVARLSWVKVYPALLLLEAMAALVFMSGLRLSLLMAVAILDLTGVLTYSIERGLVAERVKLEMRGRAEGYMNLSFYVGAALGSAMGGALYSIHPPLMLVATSMLLALGAVFSPMVFKPSPRHAGRALS